MICETCGLDNPEGFKFCPRCGALLERRARLDQSKIKTQREAVLRTVRARGSTDEIVTPTWVWVMLVVYLAGIIVSIAIGFSVAFDVLERDSSTYSRQMLFDELKDDFWLAVVLSGMFYALATALAYLLVSRLNRHFRRDHELRAGIISLMNGAASSPDSRKVAEADLAMLSKIDEQINATERKRNPIVWALVVAAPFMVSLVQSWVLMSTESYRDYQQYALPIGVVEYLTFIPLFYLSYFLGRSTYDHHSRWTDFAVQTAATSYRLGFKKQRPSWTSPLHQRSYALYTVVTILTLGFFMFYWWYTIVKDGNHHLRDQWDFEDRLVESISA